MANPAPLILIVDDEPPIRRLVHTSLDDEGYRVAEAESGQQAVRLAAQQPPDVVILDRLLLPTTRTVTAPSR